MLYNVAARRTLIGASQTRSLVAGGEPIIVYMIVAIATTAVAGTKIDIFDKDGAELLEIGTNQTEVLPITFRAGNGLAVTTEANSECTVFHSQPGT